MVKEKVKYIDDTEHEIEFNRLGFLKASDIARTHIPLNDMTFKKDGTMNLKGDINLFGLAQSCLETIKDLDLNLLTSDDANRLYKTYFERDVMSTLKGGGDPN